MLYHHLKRLLSTCLNAKLTSPQLIDTFGREHTYLRVSLTERCNLRCTYCMPEDGVQLTHNDKLLKSDELVTLLKLFARNGVNKVRFTGGEPLVRKDCVDIVREVNKMESIKTIAMTTNGILLKRKLFELKESGLNLLNISLDTLVEKKFEFISKRRGWSKVMASIESALEYGFEPLKINCVVMKGLNDDEICDFIEFTRDRNVDVRFIEYMPFDGNKWHSNKMISYRDLLAQIALKYDLKNIIKLNDSTNDTSKAFKIHSYKGKFGFITSMSDNFCSTCNRIRLTADGNLKVCLFGNSEVNLRDLLRMGLSESELMDVIGAAVKRKKAQHAGMNVLAQMKNRPMILIDNSHHSKQQIRLYSTTSDLTHINSQTKEPTQVDISYKQVDVFKPRIACASGYIQLNETSFKLLIENKLVKGNALLVAQIAGIQSSKLTSNLIPLCHTLILDNCDVKFEQLSDKYQLKCICVCKTSTSKTGVEMEALTACSIALLTIYDMIKAVQKDASINEIKLEYKYGGKSGDYVRLPS